MNAYEQKQAARKARLERAAALAGDRATSAFAKARAIGDTIPFGQPILVGHHSEGRARRDAQRIRDNMGRAVAEHRRSEDLARRASRVGSAGVSSDDPEAIAKLEAELSRVHASQAMMAAVNAAIRKHLKAGPEAVAAAVRAVAPTLSENQVRSILTADDFGKVGFARFQLTNNGANARRIEKRIAELLAKQSAPKRGDLAGVGYAVTENRELNRVQIRFDARQPAEIVAALKRHGFRWAPSLDVWQRQATAAAWRAAESVIAAVECEVAP